MMHIKYPLLLMGKSSPCDGSGFPLSLSEWSDAILYNRKNGCSIELCLSKKGQNKSKLQKQISNILISTVTAA